MGARNRRGVPELGVPDMDKRLNSLVCALRLQPDLGRVQHHQLACPNRSAMPASVAAPTCASSGHWLRSAPASAQRSATSFGTDRLASSTRAAAACRWGQHQQRPGRRNHTGRAKAAGDGGPSWQAYLPAHYTQACLNRATPVPATLPAVPCLRCRSFAWMKGGRLLHRSPAVCSTRKDQRTIHNFIKADNTNQA